MNILVVGNIVKDVYLNLDARSTNFETDSQNIKWLDLSFDASKHHFFSRTSSLGGAAISLEVLQKLGLTATISDSPLDFTSEDPAYNTASTHRYILVADEQVSYLTPSEFKTTTFTPPATPVDYIYIDRSANLSADTTQKILRFLEDNLSTRLVIYANDLLKPHLGDLISKADLIFIEDNRGKSAILDAPELPQLDPAKIISVSEDHLSYLDVSEKISVGRIDVLTHLSAYSIAAATILGCFILGYSVEDSLKLARVSVENTKLSATLSLPELKELAANLAASENPELIAASLVLRPKGILAADESGGSIHKKFEQLSIPDTYDNRRDYRNIFFTTPDLEKYTNGVILFDETARQLADNGQNFVDFLTGRRIIPGIKVDQGLEPLPDSEETYTKGLDGLPERLKEYHQMGLRFAKWRAAFNLRLDDQGNILTPTSFAIEKNCQILAKYAKDCQNAKIAPIVEPELVYDGNYDINQSIIITSQILDCLFAELEKQKVNLRACILKVNMVLAGKQQEHQSIPEEVGAATAQVLKKHVPKDLAGVVFLSGGQTVEQATDNLAAIIQNGPFPWPVTFSFARALQDPALYAWAGDNANAEKARQAFLERLKANSDALSA